MNTAQACKIDAKKSESDLESQGRPHKVLN